MAASKPLGVNFQFPAALKERLQLEMRNQKGLKPEEEDQMVERTSSDFKARINHDFLKKEVPDEAVGDSVGGQLNHTESQEAVQFVHSGQRSLQLREHAWESPKAFLSSFEGAINAYRRSRGRPNLSREAEEEDTKVEVNKMEACVGEEADLLGENGFTMDMQRTLFRKFHYLEAEGPRETCSRLWYLCHCWLKPETHTKEQILELVILEQFLAILPLETQSWVKGGCPQTCDQAVALAEDFLKRRQESQQLGQEDRVPTQEMGLNVRVPGFVKENMSCLKADGWISESKEAKPAVEITDPVKRLGISWSKETSKAFPSPGGSAKGKETYLTPRANVLFPFSGEPGEANQSMVKKRRRRTRGEKVCGVCGRSFNRTAVLVAHQRTHTGEKPFMCKDCGKCFSLKSTLVAHERTHTGERPYSCSQCGKSFTASSHLTRHYRIHIGEKPFNCLQCDKSFSRKAQLVNHQKVHTREKPYKCLECGQTFNRSSSLMIHESSHTGIKPFKCPDCDKSFKRACHLVKHQRVHTGERPYSCSECGKSFGQREILMVHQRIHTGEKPFKCTVCGKCFGDRSVLVRHQKIHTGERPHECTTCGKRFSHWAVLVRHQKIHTRDALNAQRPKGEETPTPRQIS